jgi:predicted DNA-binding protein
MKTVSVPTSIRLTPAEKKRIAAAARKRGLSPTAYIKRVALEGAAAPTADRLSRLERLAEGLREAIEDEIDAREAEAAWSRHVKSGSRLLTGEEVWRELGV